MFALKDTAHAGYSYLIKSLHGTISILFQLIVHPYLPVKVVLRAISMEPLSPKRAVNHVAVSLNAPLVADFILALTWSDFQQNCWDKTFRPDQSRVLIMADSGDIIRALLPPFTMNHNT